MLSIAVAIALPHESFGAVILPLHKAIGNARWQELEKRENFLSPMFESGERFAQRIRSLSLYFLDPGIEILGSSLILTRFSGGGGCGV